MERVRTRHGGLALGRSPPGALVASAQCAEFDIGPAPVDRWCRIPCAIRAPVEPAFAAAGGSEYRIVVDFAQPEQFLAVQNIGNSGQPGSPHYADQFEPWLAGEYHVVHLRRAEVERAGAESTVLEP